MATTDTTAATLKTAAQNIEGKELDAIVREMTAFNNFADLLSTCRGGYTPTLSTKGRAKGQRWTRARKDRFEKSWAIAHALQSHGVEHFGTFTNC